MLVGLVVVGTWRHRPVGDTLRLHVETWDGREHPTNELHEVEGPVERGDDGEVGFSGSTTWVDADTPWRDVTTVAHELGHALFGLRDEYLDASSGFPHYGYPNCAESREQAEQWWGDQVDQLDPMAERYRQLLDTYQPGMRDISDEMLAEWVGVDVHDHPCGTSHDAPASFVPTERGLMANELPILGSVNRSRVEQVLGLFSGRPATDEAPTEVATTPGRTTGDGRPWLVVLLASAAVAATATWAWRRRGGPPGPRG